MVFKVLPAPYPAQGSELSAQCKNSPVLCAPCTVHYSYLNVSTGFLVAALQLCQLTVANAITRAVNPAAKKIHHFRSEWYAKLTSHRFKTYQVTGQAIKNDISTHFV